MYVCNYQGRFKVGSDQVGSRSGRSHRFGRIKVRFKVRPNDWHKEAMDQIDNGEKLTYNLTSPAAGPPSFFWISRTMSVSVPCLAWGRTSVTTWPYIHSSWLGGDDLEEIASGGSPTSQATLQKKPPAQTPDELLRPREARFHIILSVCVWFIT